MANKKGAPLTPNIIELDLKEVTLLFGGHSYSNELAMIKVSPLNSYDIDKRVFKAGELIRIDVLTIIFVLEGSLKVTVDYVDYTLKKSSIFAFSPFNTVNKSHITPDGRYYILMAKREFLEKTIADISSLPSPQIFTSEIPLFELNNEQFGIIKSNFDTLYYYIKDKRQKYKERFLRASFILIMYEFFNQIESSTQSSIKIKEGRHTYIVHNFMKMLNEVGDVEHNPAYYADKLFISVQYLSLVLKQETRNNTSKWIAHNLIIRAKSMLRRPGVTIQQVADALHFADQSSFGKFFKKHTGISPKKYIASLND